MEEQEKIYYVYKWFLKDTGEVFYIGKGCGDRYKNTSKRNKKFKEIYNTNPDNCAVEIIKQFNNEDEAFNYEKQLIYQYWDKNEAYANIAKGGSGGYKAQWTPKMKEYLSQYNPMYELKNKMIAHLNSPMHNPQIIKKVLLSKNFQVVIDNITYISMQEAARQLKVAPGTIGLWVRRGFSSNNNPCYLLNKERDQKLKSSYTNNSKHNAKAVIIDGIEYPSIKEGAQAINGRTECLSKVLSAGKNKYKGHICSYANPQPSQENINNSILEGSTTNE